MNSSSEEEKASGCGGSGGGGGDVKHTVYDTELSVIQEMSKCCNNTVKIYPSLYDGPVKIMDIHERIVHADEDLKIPTGIEHLTNLHGIEIVARRGRTVVLPSSMSRMTLLQSINFRRSRISLTPEETRRMQRLRHTNPTTPYIRVIPTDSDTTVTHGQQNLVIFPYVKQLGLAERELGESSYDSSVLNFALRQCPNLTYLSSAAFCYVSSATRLIINEIMDSITHRREAAAAPRPQPPLAPITLSRLETLQLQVIGDTLLTTLICDVAPALPSLRRIIVDNSLISSFQPLATRMKSMVVEQEKLKSSSDSVLELPTMWNNLQLLSIDRNIAWYYLLPEKDRPETSKFGRDYSMETEEKEIDAMVTILKYTQIESLKHNPKSKSQDDNTNATLSLTSSNKVKYYLQLNYARRKVKEMTAADDNKDTKSNSMDIIAWVAQLPTSDLLYRAIRNGPFLLGRIGGRTNDAAEDIDDVNNNNNAQARSSQPLTKTDQ